MKFRRKAQTTAPATESAAQAADESTHSSAAPAQPGPASVGAAPDEVERVDLGSLLIAPAEGHEVRVQVDEATGAVQSVMLAAQDGALELQPFSAPRNGDLWSDVHPDIAADLTRRGGEVSTEDGRFGVELVCRVPVSDPDGNTGVQISRIVGINGDRWMLRASFLGRPAVEGYVGTEWEAALDQVRIRRGTEAMPVGRALPVVLPDSAQRIN